MKTFNKQNGFTIVELMVAATLGLLILAGAITMFVNNKRMYTDQEQLARMQENLRFAMDIIANDLRMVGYNGCTGDATNTTVHLRNVNITSQSGSGVKLGDTGQALSDYTQFYSFHYDTMVEGVEGTTSGVSDWFPSTSDKQTDRMIAGSDALTVRYMEPTGSHLMNAGGGLATNKASETVRISSNSDLENGDIIALSNCRGTDIVQITAAPATAPACGTPSRDSTSPDDGCFTTLEIENGAGTPGNGYPSSSDWLTRDYRPYYGASVDENAGEIFRARIYRYFIGLSNGEPALFRQQDAEDPEVFVDGIENMQILYGVDTNQDGNVDDYINAGATGLVTLADWRNVMSVKLALLGRTIEEYGPDLDTRTYNLLQSTVDPVDDRRRRKVATTTVQIRNRNQAGAL